MSVDRVAVPALPPAVAGEGPARRTSVPYLLGLVAVAAAMLALPVLYAALVLLAAWGVWRHATHHLVLLQSGAWLAVPLYFGPLAAGLVLVVFLVKPLFARGAPPPPSIPLDPEHEPALFEFVERIGELVGAPRPRRIHVNCTVNAAAWFRRGAASFLGRDLTMTLGLPLVAGLSTRQLAGIVAHELGHFTQGAGMRLTYVIRQVNNWLARVVFEPDAWDLRMEAAARSGNGAVLLVLQAARSGVWLTRRLLWLFLHLGHAASCFMLRQMEKDADVCECRVAGSDTVRDATLRVRELEAAGPVGALRPPGQLAFPAPAGQPAPLHPGDRGGAAGRRAPGDKAPRASVADRALRHPPQRRRPHPRRGGARRAGRRPLRGAGHVPLPGLPVAVPAGHAPLLREGAGAARPGPEPRRHGEGAPREPLAARRPRGVRPLLRVRDDDLPPGPGRTDDAAGAAAGLRRPAVGARADGVHRGGGPVREGGAGADRGRPGPGPARSLS